MGKGSVSSKFLFILNIIYSILGVGIIGWSIYFYLGLSSLNSLRNENDFLIRTTIYWVEALPWVFTAAGVLVILVSCCAFLGVLKKSRPLVVTNAAFQILTILLLAGSATVSLNNAQAEETDSFVRLVMSDSFAFLLQNSEANTGLNKVKEFEAMEIKLRCCGLDGPFSYNGHKLWQTGYPLSCCKTHAEDPVASCSRDNKIVNSRKGCNDIAVHHVRMAILIFAAFGVLTAFVGILSLICCLLLLNGLNNRKKAMKAKLEKPEEIEAHRSHVSKSDMETLKLGFKV